MQPGSICLFHNAAKHTPEALPGLIEKLQKDGYKLVAISEQICREKYTINNNGMQIPQKSMIMTTTDMTTTGMTTIDKQSKNSSISSSTIATTNAR